MSACLKLYQQQDILSTRIGPSSMRGPFEAVSAYEGDGSASPCPDTGRNPRPSQSQIVSDCGGRLWS